MKKKKRVNTTFWEFLKTRKYKKEIEIDVVEEIFWELVVMLENGTETHLVTLKPDSDDFKGQHVYDDFLEWYMCSDNPSYKHNFKTGLRIYVRNKIQLIELRQVVKEREITKDGKQS